MILSVICPIYNEERYIAACVESILAQDFPKEDMEVIFADGMSSDRTREIVGEYASKYSWIHMIDNPERIVPTALNRAIEASRGDIIMRMDAHAFYPQNYISTLVAASKKYDVENVGAVCRTDVLHKNSKSETIRTVLTHPLGVGNSSFRTGINEPKEVDTVPFGCWKREVFDKYGLFDERLTRNQDIEFNKRISRGGGRILLIPDTYSVYYARETFAKLARNNFGNGKWNILTVWYTNRFSSLSLRHFIPLLFVLSLFVPVCVATVWPWAMWATVLSVVLYLLAITMVSLKVGYDNRLNYVYLVITFIVLHLSYGFGSLAAMVQLPFIKR